jgi:hypothetical protein
MLTINFIHLDELMNTKPANLDVQFTAQDSKCGSPECKCIALPLHKPVVEHGTSELCLCCSVYELVSSSKICCTQAGIINDSDM